MLKYKLIAMSLAMVFITSGTAHATWTQETHKIKNKIVKLGVNETLTIHIINECKSKAKDPRKCVKTAVAIYGNESGYGKKCTNHSCWGLLTKKYNSQVSAFNDWLKRYNRWWYKHDGGSYFYGGYGWKGRSGYCHSEVSSNSKLGCPNGTKNFNYIYSLF